MADRSPPAVSEAMIRWTAAANQSVTGNAGKPKQRPIKAL
jgi:hypothetical protein